MPAIRGEPDTERPPYISIGGLNYDPAVNLIAAGVALGMSALVLSLWPPDEAKIETEPEEDEMDDGAAGADLGCFDKTCPQQGHRNIGEIKIEQNAGRHEKRARQKFAKVSVSPGEKEAPDSHDHGCSYIESKDHALLLSSPLPLMRCLLNSPLYLLHPIFAGREKAPGIGGMSGLPLWRWLPS